MKFLKANTSLLNVISSRQVKVDLIIPCSASTGTDQLDTMENLEPPTATGLDLREPDLFALETRFEDL